MPGEEWCEVVQEGWGHGHACSRQGELSAALQLGRVQALESEGEVVAVRNLWRGNSVSVIQAGRRRNK